MRITAGVRPHGLKRGVTTKKWYEAMGYKKANDIDLRDTVGHLEFDASGPKDNQILRMLHRCLSAFPDEGMEMHILDKDGKIIAQTHREVESKRTKVTA